MIFKNIGVIKHRKKDPDFKCADNLTDYLSDISDKINQNIDIYCSEKYSLEDLYEICDVLIIFGGDGSILKIAPAASKRNIPVIGINLGRIGYMSEIETNETYLLENIFNNNYIIKNRMMLDVEIIKSDGEILQAGTALNDAVVTHGVLAKLIETELSRGGVKITDYRSDGIIAATPTGSTAYSMSAGGPVIDPDIECFCVTPICPHSLVNRPLIFSCGSVLEIRNKNADSGVYLTIDGQVNIKLEENDIVKIKKSEYYAKFISVKKRGFFDVLREKISGGF
ncbi:MAG: NAD(+)/NADH kinase [Oscillospiraceae bacterium]|nr:NAD(+)/NADH kinase [Oscillospiraceae bacterium]